MNKKASLKVLIKRAELRHILSRAKAHLARYGSFGGGPTDARRAAAFELQYNRGNEMSNAMSRANAHLARYGSFGGGPTDARRAAAFELQYNKK